MQKLTAAFSCAALLATTADAQAPPKATFAVHEWGTFTSMQGVDGVVLEGLHHEEEALPSFVHSAATVEAAPDAAGFALGVESGQVTKFPATRVTQKMETPVLYFHTEVPRRVMVSVGFREGLITQYYPVPQALSPSPEELRGKPVDMAGVRFSTATWSLDLVPPSQPRPAEVPAVADDVPWSFARQVRAAYVQTAMDDCAAKVREAEHYVFYRGLGRFAMPVAVQPRPADAATLKNDGDELPFAAALQVDARGARYRVLGRVPAHAGVELGLDGVAWSADPREVGMKLGAEVMRALVEQGLFVDEARAMVATWSRQWFMSRGARVIYIVPPAAVEAVLPLWIHPQPDAVVRVLVGRLEYLTPEVELGLERAVRDLDGEADAIAAAERTLSACDRFLEPCLRRVAAATADARVRERALTLARELAR
jgi:hypothetical protein